MAKLVILKGLPSSGKSTKALEIMRSNPNAIRVNMDLLREMLFFIKRNKNDGEEWTSSKEKLTKRVQFQIIKFLLDNHKMVIIDNCNLNPDTIKKFEKIAYEGNRKFEIIEVDTPVDVCVERDKKRENGVGEAVIREYAIKHGKQKDDCGAEAGEIITFPGEKKIVLSDIDGTLSNCDHRLKYIKGKKKDWTNFFGSMNEDTLREGVAQLLSLTYKDHPVVIVTGRPSHYRSQTEEWLKKHNISYRRLLMRKAGDARPDCIVKEEMLNHFNKDEIEVAIDDRQQILTVWRRNKINTIDVGTGENF